MIRINLFDGLPRGPGKASILRGVLLGIVALFSTGMVAGLVLLTLKALSGEHKPAAQETAAPAASQPQRIAYSSMNLAQRTAYELLFTRHALEAIVAAMPRALETPDSIHIDSFAVIRIQGRAASREAVVGMLAALRTDDITLRPRPHTVVAAQGGAYTYQATAQALFALENIDNAIVRLPAATQLTDNARRLEQFAADAGVRIRRGLRYVTRQKAGQLQRVVYRMDANADVAALATFVRNVHAANLGCAFANVRFAGTAAGGSVSADIFLNAID